MRATQYLSTGDSLSSLHRMLNKFSKDKFSEYTMSAIIDYSN